MFLVQVSQVQLKSPDTAVLPEVSGQHRTLTFCLSNQIKLTSAPQLTDPSLFNTGSDDTSSWDL